MVIANLVFQASAINYNKAVREENVGIYFDPHTGQVAAFSNLSGWSVLFMGREYQAEQRLGLYIVGDYVLYREDVPKEIGAILELSDVQSRFHIWEGCLNYQSFEINIEKRSFSTIYDENNVIVIAETLIADAPAYKQKIIVLSWFDSLNLRTNETTKIWAVKVSLIKYVYNPDNQSNMSHVEAASNELLTLSKEIEKSWSPHKNPPTSFVVDLYRNKELSTALVIGTLVVSAVILQTQSFIMKARISRKLAELPEKDRDFLKNLSLERTNSPKQDKEKRNTDKDNVVSKCERFKREGILREQLVMKNGQLYAKWKVTHRINE